jgi:hypothetical protein
MALVQRLVHAPPIPESMLPAVRRSLGPLLAGQAAAKLARGGGGACRRACGSRCAPTSARGSRGCAGCTVLGLWGKVVLVPLVGTIDTRRGDEITERVLSELTVKRARYVLLVGTGVRHVDTNAADQFLRMVRSVKLLDAS